MSPLLAGDPGLYPYRGDRVLSLLPTPRLRGHLGRYLDLRAEVEANRKAWPQPECAEACVEAVIEEIEAALAARCDVSDPEAA